MNIKSFAPKSMSMDEARAKGRKYNGTFTELVSLVKENVVTLITDNSGNVTGIWVDSGTGNVMADQVSGENFARVYSATKTMEWLEKILTAKHSGNEIVSVDEEEGTYTLVNGEVLRFKEAPRRPTVQREHATVNLPEKISLEELGVSSFSPVSEIKRAVKVHTGYFMAKGAPVSIEDGYLVNIRYGRKASASEM